MATHRITNGDPFAIYLEGAMIENGTIVGNIAVAPVSAWALIVETEEDLPAAVGGRHTLPPGATLIKGVFTGGGGRPAPSLTLTDGIIHVPRGSVLTSGARRSSTIEGSFVEGLVFLEGGDMENVAVRNSGGPDIVTAGDPAQGLASFLFINEVNCSGGGIVLASPTGGTVSMRAVSISNQTGAASGLTVAAGSVHTILDLESVTLLNSLQVPGWIGLSIEAGAFVAIALFLNLCKVGELAGTPAGTTGILQDPAAIVPRTVVRGTSFEGFLGVGSQQLVGLSADDPPSFWDGNQRVRNTKPSVQLELDETMGVPPTTQILVANTWYPLNIPGAVVNAVASLFDSPAPGEVRSLWTNEVRGQATSIIGVEKVGGSNVLVKTRLEKSTDDGASWVPIGIVGSSDITLVASQITVTNPVSLDVDDRLRATITSTSITDVRIWTSVLDVTG